MNTHACQTRARELKPCTDGDRPWGSSSLWQARGLGTKPPPGATSKAHPSRGATQRVPPASPANTWPPKGAHPRLATEKGGRPHRIFTEFQRYAQVQRAYTQDVSLPLDPLMVQLPSSLSSPAWLAGDYDYDMRSELEEGSSGALPLHTRHSGHRAEIGGGKWGIRGQEYLYLIER